MKDWSTVKAEREIFVEAWQLIDRHKDTPKDKAHLSDFELITGECINLANMGAEPATVQLANGIAHALMNYYQELLKDI